MDALAEVRAMWRASLAAWQAKVDTLSAHPKKREETIAAANRCDRHYRMASRLIAPGCEAGRLAELRAANALELQFLGFKCEARTNAVSRGR